MDKVIIPIQLSSEATLPKYETNGSAGVDLRIIVPITLAPGERILAPTGIKVAIPNGFEGQIRPRSGLALKLGLGMVNSPGTIDSDYRGEIGLILINHSQEEINLNPGERVAQLVICPVVQATFTNVESLSETSRGEQGFGSTGHK